jgi:hypothetical protein
MMADREVDDALAHSFLAELPAEVISETHIQLPGLHWRHVTMEPAHDPSLAPFTESLDVMGDG